MKRFDKNLILLGIILIFNISFLCLPVMGVMPRLQTKTITTVADATLEQYNPDSNYGGDSSLEIGYYYGWLEACIKFNLSNIPNNVIAAELSLDFYYVDATTTVEIYDMSSSWNELSITWNNAPTYGAYLESFVVYQEGIYVIDITEHIESESGFWSICLSPNDPNWLLLASKECYNWQEPPEITFTYEVSNLPIILGVVIGTVVGVAVVSLIIIVVIIKKKKSREAVVPPERRIYEAPVKEVRKYCPMCGTSASVDTIFCMNCGEKLQI